MRATCILIFILLFNSAFPQIVDYNKQNYRFIGYNENKPIYQFYNWKEEGDKNFNLFYAIKNDKGIISFKKFKDFNKQLLFYQDSIFLVKDSFNKEKGYKIDLFISDEKFKSFIYKKSGFRPKYFNFIFSKKHNKLFFPFSDFVGSTYDRIAYIDFNSKYELVLLPLIGNHLSIDIEENYLFFSTSHLADCYSFYPDNIYKVPINEWGKPQLILEQASAQGWLLMPNSNIIFTKILITGNSTHDAFYNTIDKSIIGAVKYKGSRKIIRYDDKYYFEINRRNNSKIIYKQVITPTEFPIKDERSDCPNNKRIFMNISNQDKSFEGTFLTDSLLYKSDVINFKSFSKNELRFIRNAFFARQGYQFNSDDLKIFFEKFDWYKKLVKRNKRLQIANEMIVLSPVDKERIKLIKNIEKEKY